jgi:hypothetical protein
MMFAPTFRRSCAVFFAALISGGEPTVHPQIIDPLHNRPDIRLHPIFVTAVIGVSLLTSGRSPYTQVRPLA